MKATPLLAGRRWIAVLVAVALLSLAGYVAFSGAVALSISGVTFTAGAGLISTGLTAFFWYIDRTDRIRSDARQNAARRADIRPNIDFEMELSDAGQGYNRREVWVLNHGPGSASNMELWIDCVAAADLGGSPPAAASWKIEGIASKARHYGPFPRGGLAPGSANRVCVYRDSDAPSTNLSQFPIGPSDLNPYALVRFRVTCRDIDGLDIDPSIAFLQKMGGYYIQYPNMTRWIESWGLSR